jgi:hypothetical protein
LILCAFAWFLGCAEVLPPPGGEPDKTPPRIDSTLPANGSVGVLSGKTIEIQFSEQVQAGTGKAVYISPRPKTDPKLKWHGDRLTITLADSFPPNQTTVVSIGSAVTDLRNNHLDSSMTIAFSTGPSLDSGRIAGTVLKEGVGQPTVLVGLWEMGRLNDSTIIDSLYPDYLTVTDAKGNFILKFLPDKSYRLIAFVDRSKNDRFNPKRESMALPDRPIDVGGELLLDGLVMSLVNADSSGIGIVSASYSLSGMARARLSGMFSLENLVAHLSNSEMTLMADSNQRFGATALLEKDDKLSGSVTLAFGKIPAGEYRLVLPLKADSTVVYEGITVRDQEDKEPPTIIEHSPIDRPMFASEIKVSLAFSEPIDTTKIGNETFQLVYSDSIPVAIEYAWEGPLHMVIKPDTLLGGKSYKLRISEFEVFDLAGNPLGDSLTVFPFATLNADSLGLVSGTVQIRLRDKLTDPAVIEFKSIANKATYTVTVKDRKFSLNIPGGKYLLSGYLDSNRDGTRTDGKLQPFLLSETSAIHPDTIAVRARFETTGIEMTFK